MNCHSQVLKDDARLAVVRESAASGKPIPWVQIHKLPDYVYFNHSVHVNRGVSCVECHGRIDQMDEVHHDKPLSMSYCLNCHRDPVARLRPLEDITKLDWQAPTPEAQLELGKDLIHNWHVESLQNCSTCHR
jgi:formate-dependent nitrite reductase cytochrome c552 subunit